MLMKTLTAKKAQYLRHVSGGLHGFESLTLRSTERNHYSNSNSDFSFICVLIFVLFSCFRFFMQAESFIS